jgi:hypothetical protein
VDIFLSVMLIANLIAVLVLMYNIEGIVDYSVKDEGIRLKHVIIVILFLPAILLLGLAAIMTAVFFYTIDSRWFEKVLKTLNKRIL